MHSFEKFVYLYLASIGISKSYSYTKLDTIDDLNGQALNTGGSISVFGPASVGAEVIYSPSDPLNVVGGAGSVGVGLGIDVHTTASITKTKAKFNIIDVAKNAWSTVIGWFGGK